MSRDELMEHRADFILLTRRRPTRLSVTPAIWEAMKADPSWGGLLTDERYAETPMKFFGMDLMSITAGKFEMR